MDLTRPDNGNCVVPEELDKDEDAVPDIVSVLAPVLLLVCNVEEIVDEDSGESRTSKLNHIKSILSCFPKDDEQLT